MSETRYTFCRVCEAACGLRVSLDGHGQISAIEPDEQHVTSKGYACAKGLSLDKFRASPDRLTKPLKRQNGEFVEISWEQALSEIGERIQNIHSRYGGDAFAAYTGNPISFSMWPNTMLTGFLAAMGSKKLFTVGTVDCSNKFAAAERLYGSFMRQTFPDIDHTRMLISIGSNPLVSKMSFISLPHPIERIKAIEERGGEVVWINPRKTESARRCGTHLPIRPDTDIYFMLGFLRELIKQQGIDQQRVDSYMQGFASLSEIAEPWTPEKVAAVTRIPAATLCELVTRYIASDGAAIYSSTGSNQGRFGTLIFWLQECINAISGNLDRRGGTLMGRPVFNLPVKTEHFHSRINSIPSITNSIPTGILADEILAPGEGKVRALVIMSGNPVLTCAGSERLEKAFASLDLLISLDIVRNETANHAHYVLPGLHSLERSDVPFYFMSGMGLMAERFFHYTDPVMTPPGEARDEGLILRQICRAAKKPMFNSRILQLLLDLGEKLYGLPGCRTSTEQRLYGLLSRQAKIGGLNKIRKASHGIRLDDNQPGDYLGERMRKDIQYINLAPAEFVERVLQLESSYQQDLNDKRLRLISKRERFSHNSWSHNLENFVKGERHSNYLYVHPDDAIGLGLQDGSLARVSANGHSIEVPVKIDDSFMPGVVSVPHGWGHQRAGGLSIASRTEGANVNILAKDGPDSIEPWSGMSQLNGIPVEISPVEAGQQGYSEARQHSHSEAGLHTSA